MTLPPSLAEEAAAWARLLTGAYEVPLEAAGRTPLAEAELVARLSTTLTAELPMADWAMMRLGPGEVLTPCQYGTLAVVEQLTGDIAAYARLPAPFADLLVRHRTLVASAALPATGWITNPQHPARRLLAALFTATCGWQAELGAAAEATRRQVEDWFASLVAGREGWHEVADRAERWLEDERRRIERIEQRTADSEAAQMRERRVRLVAVRTINQSFAGRSIDREVAEMLGRDLLPALQWVLHKQGEQSQLWQRLKRFCGTLRWTLSPETGKAWRNKLYRLIAQATEELAELGPQVFHDAATRDRITALLDREHLRILGDEQRDTVDFAGLDASDPRANADVEVSQDVLAGVLALPVGQWLLVRADGAEKRVRVLLKQDDERQLLCVNALGMKAFSAPYETIALQLIDGTIEPLPSRLPIDACIAEVIDATKVRQQQAQQSRMERLRAMREQAAAEARLREEARQKALAEAQALETARLEAKRRAEEALREEQRRTDEAHRETQRRAEEALREAERKQVEDEARRKLAEEHARAALQQKMQRARLLASSLTIGAWMVFRDAPGVEERRRLTVVLPSSGKHIFVDAGGTGKREIGRDELIRALAEERIVPLTVDRKLDDALTRVVDNIRGDRGTGGR